MEQLFIEEFVVVDIDNLITMQSIIEVLKLNVKLIKSLVFQFIIKVLMDGIIHLK